MGKELLCAPSDAAQQVIFSTPHVDGGSGVDLDRIMLGSCVYNSFDLWDVLFMHSGAFYASGNTPSVSCIHLFHGTVY